jgi:hypothetical protein
MENLSELNYYLLLIYTLYALAVQEEFRKSASFFVYSSTPAFIPPLRPPFLSEVFKKFFNLVDSLGFLVGYFPVQKVWQSSHPLLWDNYGSNDNIYHQEHSVAICNLCVYHPHSFCNILS